MAAEDRALAPLAARRDARRFGAVNRVAVTLFVAAPIFAVVMVVGLAWVEVPIESAVAAGVLGLGGVWGFLGALSWMTATGVETTVEALQAVTEDPRLLKSRYVDEGQGQLSVSEVAEGGQLSEPDG